MKVSKEVRKLRVFEETLLSGYQRYLSLLNDYVAVGLGGGEGGGGEKKRRQLEGLEDSLTLSQSSMQVCMLGVETQSSSISE